MSALSLNLKPEAFNARRGGSYMTLYQLIMRCMRWKFGVTVWKASGKLARRPAGPVVNVLTPAALACTAAVMGHIDIILLSKNPQPGLASNSVVGGPACVCTESN